MWERVEGQALLRRDAWAVAGQLGRGVCDGRGAGRGGLGGGLSEREFARLLAELVDLPCLDLSLQVELPKLLSPAVGRLCEAIAEDDEIAGDAVIEQVLDELDTPLARERLARA